MPIGVYERSEATKERLRTCTITHGMKGTRAYVSWLGMKQRVLNPRNRRYRYYGERGISVCERWVNSFENFYADMGDRPAGLTLDRIDNDGNYEPGNCRWATYAEQAANQRHQTRWKQCRRGHAFDEGNTYIRAGDGAQICRTCSREKMRRWRASRSLP